MDGAGRAAGRAARCRADVRRGIRRREVWQAGEKAVVDVGVGAVGEDIVNNGVGRAPGDGDAAGEDGPRRARHVLDRRVARLVGQRIQLHVCWLRRRPLARCL